MVPNLVTNLVPNYWQHCKFSYKYSTKSGYKSSTKLLATLVNSVTSTVTVMTWISFIGGHVEVITDKQQQYYIVETTYAGVQAKDVEDTARNTGGHLGINKTCEKITSCFYWPGIKSDVIDYIKGCERCQ